MKGIAIILALILSMALPASALPSSIQICVGKSGKVTGKAKCGKGERALDQFRVDTINPTYCTMRTSTTSGITAVTGTFKCNVGEYLMTYSCNSETAATQIASTQLIPDLDGFFAVGVVCLMSDLLTVPNTVKLTISGVCCAY